MKKSIVITIIGVLGSIASIYGLLSTTNQPKQNSQGNNSPNIITNNTKGDVDIKIESKSSGNSYFPPIPPDSASIKDLVLTRDMFKERDETCSKTVSDIVLVAESPKFPIDEGVKLMSKDGVPHNYFLNLKEVPRSEQIPLVPIFVKGRPLQIEFYACGSGAFRYLAYAEMLSVRDEVVLNTFNFQE